MRTAGQELYRDESTWAIADHERRLIEEVEKVKLRIATQTREIKLLRGKHASAGECFLSQLHARLRRLEAELSLLEHNDDGIE
jgi:hypothetical protein